jgi:hypothetical protein
MIISGIKSASSGEEGFDFIDIGSCCAIVIMERLFLLDECLIFLLNRWIMYDIGIELMIVLDKFLFDLIKGWLAFKIELLLLFILGNNVQVIAVNLALVVLVLLEDSH